MTQLSHSKAYRNEDLESVACPLCHGARRRHLYSFRPFKVYRCGKCGFGYLSPRLKEEEMNRIYREDYFSSAESGSCGYTSYAAMEPVLKRTFAWRYKHLRPLLRRGESVLDVGCAYGYGLDVVAEDFAERCGLDVSEEAIGHARKSGHDVLAGTLTDAPWAPGSFDLITAYEVIEHVYDPVAFMERIAGLLRPGGVAAFAMPNLSSWLSKVSGRNWVSYKIPEHVGYFTPEAIRYLLGRHGLRLMFLKADFQYAPGSLVYARVGSSFPFTRPFTNLLLRSTATRSMALRVPNGNMFVAARR